MPGHPKVLSPVPSGMVTHQAAQDRSDERHRFGGPPCRHQKTPAFHTARLGGSMSQFESFCAGAFGQRFASLPREEPSPL